MKFQLVTYTRVIEKWSHQPSMTHILICCSRNHNSVSLAIFSDSIYLFKATIHHAYFLPRELGLSEQFLKGNRSCSLLSGSCTLEVEEGLFRSRWIRWRSHLYLILCFLSIEISSFLNLLDIVLLIHLRSHHFIHPYSLNIFLLDLSIFVDRRIESEREREKERE